MAEEKELENLLRKLVEETENDQLNSTDEIIQKLIFHLDKRELQNT